MVSGMRTRTDVPIDNVTNPTAILKVTTRDQLVPEEHRRVTRETSFGERKEKLAQ
jgi:hypothetical protein